MKSSVSREEVFAALARINYPGYTSDLVALGIVEDAAPTDQGYAITLRHVGEREEPLREVASRIHQALNHDLGLKKIEFKVTKVAAELGERAGRPRLPGTRWIIAVASGKGGVGKSTVAANLAIALSALGYKVGLLDADIYGPSVPMMFAVEGERPRSAGGQSFYPVEKYGLKMISIGFFVNDKTPIIWRGPMVMSAVRQFLQDTLWGTQDFLIVDLPPGTGDAQLTLAQQASLDGVVIVTTPQDVALADAARAVQMFRQVHCPLLGVVENMSSFICPDCGEREELFDSGGALKLAEEEGMPLLGEVPLDTAVCASGDAGAPITFADPHHPASAAFIALARRVSESMPRV